MPFSVEDIVLRELKDAVKGKTNSTPKQVLFQISEHLIVMFKARLLGTVYSIYSILLSTYFATQFLQFCHHSLVHKLFCEPKYAASPNQPCLDLHVQKC